MEIPDSSRVGDNFSHGRNCVVGENVTIGNDVSLGHNCIVDDGSVIGDGVVIGHNCIVGEGCTIGDRTRVMNNVELRKDTVVGVDCYVDSGVKSSGRNRIGDRVVLRYDAIIARGCDIGDDAYICPQVMTNNLDHHREEVGGAHVGRGAFVGTNATLAAGIKLADRVVIGSKAFVTRDCTVEEGIYIGMSARLKE